MIARYPSPLQNLRYSPRMNNNNGPRGHLENINIYQFKLHDNKINKGSPSSRNKQDNNNQEYCGRIQTKNQNKKDEQNCFDLSSSQPIQNTFKINDNGFKKGSSLERLSNSTYTKQPNFGMSYQSSNIQRNTNNYKIIVTSEKQYTCQQVSPKSIQNTPCLNQSAIKNSIKQQDFAKEDKSENNISINEIVKSNQQVLQNNFCQTHQLESQINKDISDNKKKLFQKEQINQIRDDLKNSDNLKREIEIIQQNIQMEEKDQRIQQTNIITNNTNQDSKQLVQNIKINKEISTTEQLYKQSPNFRNKQEQIYDYKQISKNQNFSGEELHESNKQNQDQIFRENHLAKSAGFNGNAELNEIYFQQKQHTINKQNEQFLYNAYNQIFKETKFESTPIMKTITSSSINNQNNNKSGLENSSNLNGNILTNKSAINTFNNVFSNIKLIQSQIYDTKIQIEDESSNKFRVRKIKQNNHIENSNSLNKQNTLEEQQSSSSQDHTKQNDKQQNGSNKFIRNYNEIQRLNQAKRYSPKRVLLTQNQMNQNNHIDTPTGLKTVNFKKQEGLEGSDQFQTQRPNNYIKVSQLVSSNSNFSQNINTQTQSGRINTLNQTNQNFQEKQYQTTVKQIDQLDKITQKLRGYQLQQKQQQQMLRRSSNPNTRIQIAWKEEINRGNSEKGQRQKEMSSNEIRIQTEEFKLNSRNNNSPTQYIIFRPFQTQNLNQNKQDIQKSSIKDQNSTIDSPQTTSSLQKRPLLQNLDRFEIGEIIGQGSYAIVRKAKDFITNNIVAIKVYDKCRLIDPQKRNNVRREIQILQNLDHKNIIKLMMSVDTETTVNLVMEYTSSLSLRHFLKQKPNNCLTEQEAKFIFKQVLSAVNHCHINNIAHRDLKLENILISEETNQIKIIDFGFSIKSSNDKKLKSFCGTAAYMSPEIVMQQEYAGKPTDIWALGVLLFVLLQGRFPFKGKDDSDLFKKIIKNEYKFNNDISTGAQKLINSILKTNPQDRPTTKTILKDSWLNEI